ncbi:MAG: hypothetical protein JWN95_859 [Frankiales bacterium]|nr:hypothetical protein [Frankiales bacterium]
MIRHPNSAYFIVAFVALCATAIVRGPIQALIYLIPLAGVVYIVRTATIVDEDGLRARAVFGEQAVSWSELTGLRLADSGAVYAVDDAGSQLRLPCVRSTKLEPLIRAADGRIPDPAA